MMVTRNTLFIVASVAMASMLVGCGDSVGTAPVSGRVTLDGAPLATAHISFEPVRTDTDSPSVGSYAQTDSDGKYTLRLVTTDEQGAMPGTHKVRITTARAEDPSREDSPISPELVPPAYRDGIDFEVPADGTESADFALSTQK